MEQQKSWIMTYTGKQFDLVNPKPEMVDLLDIAHSLSQNCRFTGHTRRFYSVATHSILVAKKMRDDGLSAYLQILGIAHDFSEAYLTDINRPLKALLGPIYTDMEDKVQACILEHFNIPEPTEKDWKIVKYYDDYILANEIGQLMTNPDLFQIEPKYDVSIPAYSMAQSRYELCLMLGELQSELEEEATPIV